MMPHPFRRIAATRHFHAALAASQLAAADRAWCAMAPHPGWRPPRRLRAILDAAITHAAADGNAAMVAWLLAHHGRPAARHHEPLLHAVLLDRTDIAILLLDAGADPTAQNGDILRWACNQRGDGVLDLLLSRIPRLDAWGADLLWMTITANRPDRLPRLLAMGANPDARGGWLWAAMATHNRRDEMMTLLLVPPRDTSARATAVTAGLVAAAAAGRVEMVTMLLAAGANPHDGDEAPMGAALAGGHLDTAHALLAAGARIPAAATALLGRAAAKGYTEVVGFLVRTGISPADAWALRAIVLRGNDRWPPVGVDERQMARTLDAWASEMTEADRAALATQDAWFPQVVAMQAASVRAGLLRRSPPRAVPPAATDDDQAMG